MALNCPMSKDASLPSSVLHSSEGGTDSEEWQMISQSYLQSNANQTAKEHEYLFSEKLLQMLTSCIRVLPDSMVKQITSHVVKLDQLLVMANHCRDYIRAAVIRLLHAVVMRNEEEGQRFVKQNGLLLLANQIQPYIATTCVVESCMSLCFGVDVTLEQVADPCSIWPENPTAFQLHSLVLLCTLLPNSAVDPALFHNLVTILRSLCSRFDSVLKFLLDLGIVESLIKTIIAVAHTNHSSTDILEQREDDILIEGIQRFVILITNKSIISSGNVQWQLFLDMFHLFHYMERAEMELCGPKSKCARMLHDCCCIMMKQAIETLQEHAIVFSVGTTYDDIPSFRAAQSKLQQNGKTVWNTIPPSLNRRINFEKRISKSELVDRFRTVLVASVDHAILVVERDMSNIDVNYTKGLLVTYIKGLSSLLERQKSPFRNFDSFTDWLRYQPPDPSDASRSLFWNCRETLKVQLSRLVLFLLNPIQHHSIVHFAVCVLHENPFLEEILRILSATDADFKEQLDTCLSHFLHYCCSESIEHSTIIRLRCISRCLVPLSPPPNQRRRCHILDVVDLKREAVETRNRWWRNHEEFQQKILQRYDIVYRHSLESAVKMTHAAVASQHSIRKAFFENIRQNYTNNGTELWEKMVDEMTHERAIWYFPQSYLKGWQIDPTEGFQRLRIRLKRCALKMDRRYFLSRRYEILEPEQIPQPLEYILSAPKETSVDRIAAGVKVLRIANCCIIAPSIECHGELFLTENRLQFVRENSPSNGALGSENLSWQYDEIRRIYQRRYELQDRALELFFVHNQTAFMVFSGVEERNVIWKLLFESCPKLLFYESLSEITQLWRENQITNFEYLTLLNELAGRTYNDLMQYPIFPFVLADYESTTLNLEDPHVYRNFKKPMAVQNDARESHYIENYNYLKKDYENRPQGSVHGPNFGPFHYGSLYSNPGIVLHFLVRLPPFTKMLMEYQDRSFDVPDRSFHSIRVSWRLASSDSTTDVKELIPEFFYLPEFLVNHLGFNFGTQQSGDAVDDVQLPPWCQNDPRLFILIHRQALESSWVRDHLHHWIDLIFGYKQTGPAAVEAINVFHPATYEGFDLNCADPIEQKAKLTMIRSYGQVPRQLFRYPHPMSIQHLNGKSTRKTQRVLPFVDNLQWGQYVGSPTCQDPILKFKELLPTPVHSFLPLRTGDTYSLGPFTAPILVHSYDKDSILGRPAGILGVGLILWGQSDGIVRIKVRKDQPVKPLLNADTNDWVVLCSTAPDYDRIWVAFRTGVIKVYPFKFDPVRSFFELTSPPTILMGHIGPAVHLSLNAAFGVAVSAGSDGTCVIWDMHRMNYIRQFIPGHTVNELNIGEVENRDLCDLQTVKQKGCIFPPVCQLATSPTLGDIACVIHETTDSSRLELRNINGRFIGAVNTRSLVTSVCFSTAPEGISVNVVATGHLNGMIQLWSTWDLSPVRDITTDCSSPIICVGYNSDSQQLLASNSDGTVFVWETPQNKRSSRHPPFINVTLQ